MVFRAILKRQNKNSGNGCKYGMDFLERSMTKDLVVLEMGFHDLVGFKGMERGCSEVGFLEKIFLLLNIVGDVDVLFFVSFVLAINNE